MLGDTNERNMEKKKGKVKEVGIRINVCTCMPPKYVNIARL